MNFLRSTPNVSSKLNKLMPVPPLGNIHGRPELSHQLPKSIIAILASSGTISQNPHQALDLGVGGPLKLLPIAGLVWVRSNIRECGLRLLNKFISHKLGSIILNQ